MDRIFLIGGRRSQAAIALLAFLFLCVHQRAWAEPVTTIRSWGSPANRVDIVILGDGYTADELNKYAADVEGFIEALFTEEPFWEYQRYFNVYRVDVASRESGADHPERDPPVFRDTAFDAAFNCAGIQRLICVNTSKVYDVVSRSLPAPDQRDLILVIVNDTQHGGSGGAVAVTSLNSNSLETMLHELGHSFGLLADEYGGPPPPACDAAQEPPEVNATREIQRSLVKWTPWINPFTPVPTTSNESGVPGLYEGARYCDAGLFRATNNSKMRSLYKPYEQINSEQLVKRIYNWVSPIEVSHPAGSTLALSRTDSQSFQVWVPAPLTHELGVTWRLDGQVVGNGTIVSLYGGTLALGSHTLEVEVHDPTGLVRNDPQGLLSERRSWGLQVTAVTLRLNQSIFRSGESLSLSAAVTPGGILGSVDAYVALALPGGSLLFLQGDGSFTPSLQPIVHNWTVGPFTGQIFSYTFAGAEPVGNYTWLAAFTQPGTLNFIGPIVSAPFSFSP